MNVAELAQSTARRLRTSRDPPQSLGPGPGPNGTRLVPRGKKREGHPLVRMPFSAHATGSWAVLDVQDRSGDPLGSAPLARRCTSRASGGRDAVASRQRHAQASGLWMRLRVRQAHGRQGSERAVSAAANSPVDHRSGRVSRATSFRTGAGWSARLIWPRRLTANDEPIRTLRLARPAVKRIHTGTKTSSNAAQFAGPQLADAWKRQTGFAGCARHELRVHGRAPQQIMQRDRGRTGAAPAPSVTHWRLRCRRSPPWLEYSA